ncbi:MAG: hypothetical protein KBT46_03285 [Ruminococcus sp.]|nr:hypothetical protein [Candidatus Copronaster equi]
MSAADFAAKAVKSISAKKGKKIAKKGAAPELEKVMPTTIKNTTDGKFDVGFAMKETMPDDFDSRTYFIAGHHPGQKMTGIHDPITVRAMWIGVGDEGGIMMVSADMIGLTNAEVKLIRASLDDFCEKAKCKTINICCTHTHGGFDTVGYWGKLPKTGKVDSYMQKIFKNIKEVCLEAYDNRTKGDLFIGTTHVPEGSIKRREPNVQHDTMTRIRFVPDNGEKETWLINFAAHPNTLGGQNTLCSADYPYFMRETIYKEKDVNVLYGIGAIGAVDPGFPEIEDKWKRTEMEGELLGKAALSINNDEKQNPEITVLRQPFYYTADNAVLSFLGILHVMSTTLVPDSRSEIGMALVSEMSYMKIGSQQILILPGEAFPDVAYGGSASAEDSATGRGPEINPPTFIDVAKDENLLIFGVSNDMTGYVVAPNDFILHKTQPYLTSAHDRFDRNHYHETNSLGYSAAKTLTSTFADIMSRVK